MAEFLGWSMNHEVPESDAADDMSVLLHEKKIKEGFRTWCKMQDAITRAYFSFRDSFSGPVACIFDPKHLLSGANVTEYDLIHIVENYSFNVLGRDVYEATTNERPPDDAICVLLNELRDQKHSVSDWSGTRHNCSMSPGIWPTSNDASLLDNLSPCWGSD